MGEKSGRIKPDKFETIFALIGAIILLAAALQSLDDPTSRQGIAQIIGTFGFILLAVWWMYASRLTQLTVSDLWLGVSLLVIVSIIGGAVVYANWPIDRDLVADFGPIVAICLLWGLYYIVRSMLNS